MMFPSLDQHVPIVFLSAAVRVFVVGYKHGGIHESTMITDVLVLVSVSMVTVRRFDET